MLNRTWIHQISGYELGNFITLTPAIKAMSLAYNKKINVFFSTPMVRSVYQNTPYINVLDKKPQHPAFLTSKNPKRIKDESDYQANYRICHKQFRLMPALMPDAFIGMSDYQFIKDPTKVYIGLINGRRDVGDGNNKWVLAKIIPETQTKTIVQSVLSFGCIPVFLGSSTDRKYWESTLTPDSIDFLGRLALPDSISVLSQCDAFIANDSGLYHVGAALKKTGFIVWKATNFQKNKSPNMNLTHCHLSENNLLDSLNIFLLQCKK